MDHHHHNHHNHRRLFSGSPILQHSSCSCSLLPPPTLSKHQAPHQAPERFVFPVRLPFRSVSCSFGTPGAPSDRSRPPAQPTSLSQAAGHLVRATPTLPRVHRPRRHHRPRPRARTAGPCPGRAVSGTGRGAGSVAAVAVGAGAGIGIGIGLPAARWWPRRATAGIVHRRVSPGGGRTA